MGKDAKSLEESRKIRSKFIREFGCVPDSILRYNRQQTNTDKSQQKRRYDSKDQKKRIERNVKDGRMMDLFMKSASGRSCRGGKKGGLSLFPQDIGRILVKFYTKPGDLIYDPFAGHNSRMQLCYECGRSYIGVDISKSFTKENRRIRRELLQSSNNSLIENNCKIKLIHGSSAKVDLPDNYADFTITSPPYWDLEWYGDEPEQLGKNKRYSNFLRAIHEHIKENIRILKPGTFCCWCINDFVKSGIYYPYHADLIFMFQENNICELFTIYIIDLGKPIAESFVQGIIKTKRFPKRHEYCLVFKKLEK